MKKDNYQYVGACVKEWMEKNLKDARQIEEFLQEVDRRHFLYKRVMKALGFSRNASEEERRLMDTWFEDMGFSIEKVLEACGKTSGISNPNINYVNQVLVNWHTGKPGGPKTDAGKKSISVADVYRYYDIIRKQAEDEADGRREDIYSKLPRIKAIDEELRLCAKEMSKIVISARADKKQQAAKLNSKISGLSDEKADALRESGYSESHMEAKYRCAACKDTGTNDQDERCACFKEMQNEAETWLKTTKK